MRHIASLGSSFAAGPGIPPLVDRRAGRSARNYPHLLAERFGARLTDLTVSGATTETLLSQQVPGVPPDADLVTVTAGGNDLGYAAGLLRAAVAGRLAAHLPTRALGRRLGRDAVPPATDADVERATAGLTSIVAAVRQRAPHARVVLVDYLTVVGPDTVTSPAIPLDAAQLDGFRRVARRLAEAFAAAAERSGADLVRMSERSAGHAVGSPEPWVTPFRLPLRPTPFHPNAAGMRAAADALHAQLG